MALLDEVVAYLDQELDTVGIQDYPGALNGLQLQNSGEVPRILAAVDASLPVIEKAAAGGPGLLIVHHGMFWQGARPLTGAFYRKIRTAMEAGLAIYSSHLPLDFHPRWGNNIRLAQAIDLEEITPFMESKGRAMGLRGTWRGERSSLASIVGKAVGGPVHLCPGGPEEVSRVGLVTGGAGSEIAKAAAEGIDTFITGEGPHWSYPLAEELGINVLYAGHYATETFGVKALAAMLAERHGIPWTFIDHPTGL
ncbi:MAG: Nif3-like dinuclear metal center hexameric protein [Verrucomicrobiaceae bacterium]|nr:MAG: Nif3-like dinuclear metal center hexameric protein [Verrucomicrobiaceae bacterium]